MKIYYFSGTGNSLATARELAKRLQAKTVAISSVINNDTIDPDTDAAGIVFPVYYATNDTGIPLIIERFIKKCTLHGRYIFAVATYGYMKGNTIENLQKLIASRGGVLSAGFTVCMENKILGGKKQKKIDLAWNKKLDVLCEAVEKRETGRYETRGILGKVLIAPLMPLIRYVFKKRYVHLSGAVRKTFKELIPLADASFECSTQCAGCGTCAKVCPAGNIIMVLSRPVWQHHCENCYACFQWCPQKAISGDIVSYNDHYRNPYVSLSDMLDPPADISG